MSLPKSMVDALQEELLLVAGGSVGQEASTTNNADGTCSGTNNDSGKCSGTCLMSYIKRAIIILMVAFGKLLFSHAQNVFYGEILSKTEESGIANVYVLLIQNGKVFKTTSSDKKGHFSLDNVPNGNYAVEVTCIGYQAVSDSLHIKETTKRVFKLKEEAKNLAEVTVVADRSRIVKRTANGEVFYLSADAKKMNNPFRALQEIPAIISDANTSSVKMLNGETPLILINGNMVNSGIGPISPADIESVEVVNSVSARYLQEGVTSILNIKLKKHTQPYLWLEGATRHEIPLGNGFGVGYFEVGNHKVSLYGRAAYHYKYDDDIESLVNRTNTGYEQSYNLSTRKDASKWIGELLLKYQITTRDYFAAQIYDTYNTTKEKGSAQGFYQTDISQVYGFNSFDKNKSNILTTSLYYKHTFSKNSELELRLAYNFNKNKYSANRTDFYDTQRVDADTRYDNKRHSGSFNIDYSKEYANNGSLIAGSRSTLVMDDINNVVGENPLFKHRNYSQYVYIGYGGSCKFLRYNASVGLEGIWAKAGNASYGYFRPRGNVSTTWVINSHNSIRLSYRLTNKAPNVAYLNPYNTSTDSLLVSIGNPNLKPQMIQYASASYTLNVGKLYFTPTVDYKYISDMIETCGYSKGGVYYSTYANTGHFAQTSAGADLSYRFKWGRLYAGGGWVTYFYTGQEAKSSAYASFGFNARMKAFSFYGDVDYNSREYTALACTKYAHPSMANLQVNYNFTPDFYIGVCLQHITGEYQSKTTTIDGSYRSTIVNHYKDQKLRPWVILRYTFRKNADKKHKLGKVLDSTEEGISILK